MLAGIGNNILKLFIGSIISTAVAGWSLLQIFSISTSSDYVIISFALLVNGLAPMLDFGISRFKIRQVASMDFNDVNGGFVDWAGLVLYLSIGVGLIGFVVSLGYIYTVLKQMTLYSIEIALLIGLIGSTSLYVSALRSMLEFKGRFGLISSQRILFSIGLYGVYLLYSRTNDLLLTIFMLLLLRFFNFIVYSVLLKVTPEFKTIWGTSFFSLIKTKELLWISGCNIIYFLLVMIERFFAARFFSAGENAAFVFVLEVVGFLFVAASSLNTVLYPHYAKGLGVEWTTSRPKTMVYGLIGVSLVILVYHMELGSVIILNKILDINLFAICSTGAVFNLFAGVKLSAINARGNYKAPFQNNTLELILTLVLVAWLGSQSIHIFALIFTLRYVLDFVLLSFNLKPKN